MVEYPDYVPTWYDPAISYAIMQQFGDKSDELREYLDNGNTPEGDE